MTILVTTMERDTDLERDLLMLLLFMDIMKNLIMDLAMNIPMTTTFKMDILAITMGKVMASERDLRILNLVQLLLLEMMTIKNLTIALVMNTPMITTFKMDIQITTMEKDMA